jgi:pSer/pThr/pTyr-binding forkhead associated (FHA) protein
MAGASKVQLRLGERIVAEVAFEGAELRIGRMKENDLVINNLAVSRFHAVLRRVGDAFEIEDLGSENGILVDGQAISGSSVVPEGAAITIGKHTLQLVTGGKGTTQPPIPRKSDVWDAAQTYFVGGPPPGNEAEEAVAETMEAERDEEEAVVDAVEEPESSDIAVEVPESSGLAVEEESPGLESLLEPVAADPSVPAPDVAAEPAAPAPDVAAEAPRPEVLPEVPPLEAVPETPPPEAMPETPWMEPVPERPLVEAGVETPPDEGALEALAMEAEAEAAVAAEAPQALALPDPGEAVGFDEEELVGGALPDPVAAEGSDAVVEAEEMRPPAMEPTSVPAPPSAPDVLEAPGQTSLFDFWLSGDLGLSDRSLARAAASGPVAEAAAAAMPAMETPDDDPSAGALHAGLIVERGGRVERVVAWDTASLLVGRAPECSLVLGGSGVSRRHAELTREAGAHAVRDLGSANGVYVNGTRVETVSLTQGDVIRIDDYALTFVLDREPIGGSVQSDAAREPAARGMSERDLVLAEDTALDLDEEDKQVEASASAGAEKAGVDEPLIWAFEVAIATERLPEALRRALEEMDAAELVLPAQLRLVRRS